MSKNNNTFYNQFTIEEYYINKEPFYLPVADEIQLFEAAYNGQIPILLKGPTGTGKTRFVEYMAWKLSRPLTIVKNNQGKDPNAKNGIPLVTIACHEDLTASDLVGRYLLDAEGTRWMDGPLARAVKSGAICYLDEIVEARKDTTVLIHPLADHRRTLPVEKQGIVLEAKKGFQLVISYNPGYQSALKDLKESTRQRFIAIEFSPPPPAVEAEIIRKESGCTAAHAKSLAKLGEKVRNLQDHGLKEGASTRILIYAGKLISQGISPKRACHVSVVWGITDDAEVQRSVEEIVTAIFAN